MKLHRPHRCSVFKLLKGNGDTQIKFGPSESSDRKNLEKSEINRVVSFGTLPCIRLCLQKNFNTFFASLKENEHTGKHRLLSATFTRDQSKMVPVRDCSFHTGLIRCRFTTGSTWANQLCLSVIHAQNTLAKQFRARFIWDRSRMKIAWQKWRSQPQNGPVSMFTWVGPICKRNSSKTEPKFSKIQT